MAAVALVEAGDSSGSGFMAARHLVVTNEHVIRGAVAADLKVHFPESKQDYRVESVVYEDADRDLAILLVRADVLPIALAYDDSAAVGDTVKVLGNPSLGGGVILKNARTSGRVAAEVRIQSADFLQLDATVNPGSSGGPILNEDGQVIAVTAMKATAEGEQLIREGMAALNESFGKRSAESLEAGIAFGIPSRDAARALDIVLQQSAADAAAVSARHDLQIVFERLVALAGLRYVQALAFSGQHIKHQAFVARSRGLAKGMVEMLPAARDMSVAKAFESGAAESVIAKLSENLSRDVEALKSNRSVSAQARKGLRLIVDLLGDLEAFAHQNHRNYVQFSQQMLRYQQVMRQTFEALDKELNEKSQ